MIVAEKKIRWNASESEIIEPYSVCHDGLTNSKLRLKSIEQFDASETRFIEDDDFWKAFRPQCELNVDFDELEANTELERDEISVSIVIRDRILNKFLRIAHWNAVDLPNDPVDLKQYWNSFSRSERLDICLLALPKETRDRGRGIANNKTDVLCRKTFKIRAISLASKIPHRWVLPEEFERRGASEDTIWLIDWIGADVELPTKENAILLFNEKYKEKFQLLEKGGEHANLFLTEMAAAVASQLALRALDDEEVPVEDIGMKRAMFDMLKEASGMLEDGDILALLQDKTDKAGIVHAWAQKYVKLNTAIEKT